jgi:hypothetical protein
MVPFDVETPNHALLPRRTPVAFLEKKPAQPPCYLDSPVSYSVLWISQQKGMLSVSTCCFCRVLLSGLCNFSMPASHCSQALSPCTIFPANSPCLHKFLCTKGSSGFISSSLRSLNLSHFACEVRCRVLFHFLTVHSLLWLCFDSPLSHPAGPQQVPYWVQRILIVVGMPFATYLHP